ncbi:hypothetical protein NC652_001672 [Populus alba x Populus x berolinensis]|nr:hypothetical protein NC652_001672 [Populus alba x Populus x berolinensis]
MAKSKSPCLDRYQVFHSLYCYQSICLSERSRLLVISPYDASKYVVDGLIFVRNPAKSCWGPGVVEVSDMELLSFNDLKRSFN